MCASFNDFQISLPHLEILKLPHNKTHTHTHATNPENKSKLRSRILVLIEHLVGACARIPLIPT
jgi:hypothetical protein